MGKKGYRTVVNSLKMFIETRSEPFTLNEILDEIRIKSNRDDLTKRRLQIALHELSTSGIIKKEKIKTGDEKRDKHYTYKSMVLRSG